MDPDEEYLRSLGLTHGFTKSGSGLTVDILMAQNHTREQLGDTDPKSPEDSFETCINKPDNPWSNCYHLLGHRRAPPGKKAQGTNNLFEQVYQYDDSVKSIWAPSPAERMTGKEG